MNILLVNWQDPENPQSGGAEIHLFEIFGRLAAAGHRVRLVCSGWPGGATRARLQDIEIERVSDRERFLTRPFARATLAEHRELALNLQRTGYPFEDEVLRFLGVDDTQVTICTVITRCTSCPRSITR